MTKTHKYLAVAAAVTSMVAMTSTAHASTYALGTIGSGIGNIVENVLTGAFTDTFTFTLSDYSKIGAEVDNLPLNLTFNSLLTHVLNIANLAVTLEGPSGILTSAPSATSLVYSNLAANTPYTLVATGIGTGTAGGTYALDYDVAPMPLPAALPLFGLALIGFVGVAKRKSFMTGAV